MTPGRANRTIHHRCQRVLLQQIRDTSTFLWVAARARVSIPAVAEADKSFNYYKLAHVTLLSGEQSNWQLLEKERTLSNCGQM